MDKKIKVIIGSHSKKKNFKRNKIWIPPKIEKVLKFPNNPFIINYEEEKENDD